MFDDFIRVLREHIENIGLSIDDDKLAQFDVFRRELKEWNRKINLTSLSDDLDIIDKHFIDSLLLLRYEAPAYGVRVVDVGTGAGFPGLPIKICRPDIRLLLLESIGKKARFLEHMVARLGLEDVTVVNERAEIAARMTEYREQFDLSVARAVAQLPTLSEYCLPLVSVGGMFVAYKGRSAKTEVKSAEPALKELGGLFRKIEFSGERALIFISKVKRTPDQYPRRPGIPQKRPLSKGRAK